MTPSRSRPGTVPGPARPAILVVGSVALDTVTTPRGKAEDVLGGSASYFSLVASALTEVRLVGVVGSDFPDECRVALEAAGVDVGGLTVEEGKTFRWEGVYGADLVGRRSLRTELNVFETFRPRIPAAFRKTPIVFLANIDPDLQAAVLDQMESPSRVVLDTMDFWMTGKKKDALVGLLGRVQVVLVDQREAQLLTDRPRLADAVEWIQDRGPRIVVVKRGDCGALARLDDDWFWIPPYPVADVVDPTGAGDSFAGGFLGSLARWGDDPAGLRRGLIIGAAAASRAIEGFGALWMAGVELEEILERARVIADMGRLPYPDPVLNERHVVATAPWTGGEAGGPRQDGTH